MKEKTGIENQVNQQHNRFTIEGRKSYFFSFFFSVVAQTDIWYLDISSDFSLGEEDENGMGNH